MRSSVEHACRVGLVALLFVQGAWFPARALDPMSEALVGHWRQTTISFGQPRDEHLVLNSDGSVEHWIVTAGGRTPAASGMWEAADRTLTLQMQGQNELSRPFTFYQGQLVFPNIQNRRGFWQRIAP